MDGILLIFRDVLCVSIVDAISPVFANDNERFVAMENGEFNGFYNLLRKVETQIIGIQFYPFEPDVGRYLDGFDYVSSHFADGGDCELTIFFGAEGEEVHNLTILQEWGKNYFYKSETGTLALSFGVPLKFYTIVEP